MTEKKPIIIHKPVKTYTPEQWQNKVRPYGEEIWNAYMKYMLAKNEAIKRMRSVFGFHGVLVNVDMFGVKFELKKEKGHGTIPPVFLPFEIEGEEPGEKD